MILRLFIVRHGNTFDPGDTVKRVGARTDLPLSSSGQAQAQALARHFAGMSFARALTSPLTRTRQTAETILAAQVAPPALTEADFLREIDYGPDENQPESAVLARIGEAAIRAWDERAEPPPDWQVDPDTLTASWRELFNALARNPDAGPVLVVTSNGIARFALRAAASLPPGLALKLKTGAYGVIAITRDGHASVEDWNIRPESGTA